MTIRDRFIKFIGGSYDSYQTDFHNPSKEQVESQAFDLFVPQNSDRVMRKHYLAMANVGHNVSGFKDLPEEVQRDTLALAERGGEWKELDHHGEDARKAAIHWSNVVHGHDELRELGDDPATLPYLIMTQELAAKVAGDLAGPVALCIRSLDYDRSSDELKTEFIKADIFPVEQQQLTKDYAPRGVYDDRPLARVWLDVKENLAYKLPDEEFLRDRPTS